LPVLTYRRQTGGPSRFGRTRSCRPIHSSSLLLAALVIATVLYSAMIRRRHAEGDGLEQRMRTIAHDYGRSGLP
jgi:hypothetical protein